MPVIYISPGKQFNPNTSNGMKQFLTLLSFLLLHSISAHAQWAQTNGLYAVGTIRSFTNDGTHLYAGIMNNCVNQTDIHRSDDAGVTWTSITNGLPRFTEVFVLQLYGNKLFTATHDGVNSVGNGIYVSNDQGNSWAESDSGLPPNAVVSAMAARGPMLYAAVADGWYPAFYASADSGATWTYCSALGGTTWSIAFLGSHIYVGTTNGVFKSTNGGFNWTLLSNGLPPSGAVYEHVFTVGQNVFASASYTGYSDGLYVSTNGGASWSVDSVGLPFPYPVQSHVTVGNVVYVTSYGVFASYDGGFSWANTGTNEIGYLTADPTYLYVGIQPTNGVWRTPLALMTGEHSAAPLKPELAPNPFSTVTTLSFPAHYDHARITIFDLSGKTVRDFECSGTRVQLDRSGMESGLYLLRMTGDDGSSTEQKLIVQ